LLQSIVNMIAYHRSKVIDRAQFIHDPSSSVKNLAPVAKAAKFKPVRAMQF